VSNVGADPAKWRRIVNWGVIALGLVTVAWGIVMVANPQPVCRGVVMQPGDVCHYASPTDERTEHTQTYEQRVDAARQSSPIMIGTGVVVTAFGALVHWQFARNDARRTQRGGEASAGE